MSFFSLTSLAEILKKHNKALLFKLWGKGASYITGRKVNSIEPIKYRIRKEYYIPM